MTLLVSLLFLMNPLRPYAWGILEQEFESANDRYRFYLELAPYNVSYYNVKIKKGGQVVTNDNWPANNTYQNHYVECNGTVTFTWHESNGTVIGTKTVTTTQVATEAPGCTPSGGGEPPPDGGGETPPYEVEDLCDRPDSYLHPVCPDYNPPPPDDGGGTEPPPDGGGTTLPPCPSCEMFVCPGWNEYMGKINDIIDGFPTIVDAIADQTDTIRDEIVGQPPSLPSEPSYPDPVDTYDFENSAPSMKENPDLGDSGFTLSDLEKDAPEIQFRDDPTGGFNIVDPVEALPKPPAKFPIPGETDAGEWQQNNPVVITPEPPIVELHPYTPYPLPGDGGGNAPVPENNTEGPDTSDKYKTHPDNPDGV